MPCTYIRNIIYMLLTLACKKYSNSNIAAKTKNKVFFVRLLKLAPPYGSVFSKQTPGIKLSLYVFIQHFHYILLGCFFPHASVCFYVLGTIFEGIAKKILSYCMGVLTFHWHRFDQKGGGVCYLCTRLHARVRVAAFKRAREQFFDRGAIGLPFVSAHFLTNNIFNHLFIYSTGITHYCFLHF